MAMQLVLRMTIESGVSFAFYSTQPRDSCHLNRVGHPLSALENEKAFA
jgi:hypothetical protein